MKKIVLYFVVPILIVGFLASQVLKGQGEPNPNRLPCTYALKKQVAHANQILEISIAASRFLPEKQQCEYDVSIIGTLKGNVPDVSKSMKIYDDIRDELPIRGELSASSSCGFKNETHLLFLHEKYSDEFFQSGTMNCRGGVFLKPESDKVNILKYIEELTDKR